MSTEASPSPCRILLLFAHPSQARSEVNGVLFNAAKQHKAVTSVDLYAEYPDFNINIELVCKDLGDSEVTANIEDLLSLDFANDDEEQVSPTRYIR